VMTSSSSIALCSTLSSTAIASTLAGHGDCHDHQGPVVQLTARLWRQNGVVPVRVPVVAFQGYCLELLVGDLHADRVVAGVEIGLNPEAGAGGGTCDQFDDGAVRGEGFAGSTRSGVGSVP